MGRWPRSQRVCLVTAAHLRTTCDRGSGVVGGCIEGLSVTLCAKHQVTYQLQFIETRCRHLLSPDRFAFLLLALHKFLFPSLSLSALPLWHLCWHMLKVTLIIADCTGGWWNGLTSYAMLILSLIFLIVFALIACVSLYVVNYPIQSACLVYSHFLNMSAGT